MSATATTKSVEQQPSAGAAIARLVADPSAQSSSPRAFRELVRVMRDDGSIDPAHDPHLADELALAIYSAMVRNRMIDERMLLLQRQGRVGFHVGSLGEEATIVASAAATRPQDWLFPCYRELGALLYRGFPLQRYVDNMFGNADDVVRGRQMPDHYTGRAYHYASVSSVIGTQITHAVGVGMAAKLRREDVVSLCYFGDGATSSSDFHSGMNFAGVYKTPTVFLLRNNGYAISVPASKQTACAELVDKATGYGVRGVRCDGNDALAVYLCTKAAVERAARGEGATLLEMLTYRVGSHSSSDDPKVYRKEPEVEMWRAKDPIARMRTTLEKLGIWSDAEQRKLEESITSELGECIRRAEHKPPPPLESMFDDVYAELPSHLRDQRAQLLRGPRAPRSH